MNWKLKLLEAVRRRISSARHIVVVPDDLNLESNPDLMRWLTDDYVEKAYMELHSGKNFQYAQPGTKPKPKNRMLDLEKPNVHRLMHETLELALKMIAEKGLISHDLSVTLLSEAKAARETRSSNRAGGKKSIDDDEHTRTDPLDASVIFKRTAFSADEIEMFAGYRFDVYRNSFNLDGFYVREILKFGEYEPDQDVIPAKWYIRVHDSKEHGDGTHSDGFWTMEALAVKVDDDIFVLALYEHDVGEEKITRKRRFLIESEPLDTEPNDARWGVIFSRVPPTEKHQGKPYHPVWSKACMLRIGKCNDRELLAQEVDQVIMATSLEGIMPDLEREKYPYKAEIIEEIFEALHMNDEFSGSLFFSGIEDDHIGISGDKHRLTWPKDK